MANKLNFHATYTIKEFKDLINVESLEEGVNQKGTPTLSEKGVEHPDIVVFRTRSWDIADVDNMRVSHVSVPGDDKKFYICHAAGSGEPTITGNGNVC